MRNELHSTSYSVEQVMKMSVPRDAQTVAEIVELHALDEFFEKTNHSLADGPYRVDISIEPYDQILEVKVSKEG